MALKLPETIRIGSIDYVLGYDDKLSTNEGLLGQINYSACKIVIDPSIPTSKAREVLVHEITHGLLFEAGYEEHSEEQVNRIGKVLAMLLRDNDFTFMREDD